MLTFSDPSDVETSTLFLEWFSGRDARVVSRVSEASLKLAAGLVEPSSAAGDSGPGVEDGCVLCFPSSRS